MRCARCKKRQQAKAEKRWRAKGGAALRQHEAEQLRLRRLDPVKRKHDLAVKKAWRARNVVKIKLEKRQWRLNPNRPGGYSSREKWAAYHAAYRAKHREHRRELAIAQYYREHPNRPAPVCACGCGLAIPFDGNGRPRKWYPEHQPYQRCLTIKERLMSAAGRSIVMLEAAAAKTRAKLAGTEALQKELKAIEDAIKVLKTVATAEDARPRKGKRAKEAGHAR